MYLLSRAHLPPLQAYMRHFTVRYTFIDILKLATAQPYSKLSLKTAADDINKATCADKAFDTTSANIITLGSTASLFLFIYDLIYCRTHIYIIISCVKV